MTKYYLQMTISFFIGQNFKKAYQYEKNRTEHTQGGPSPRKQSNITPKRHFIFYQKIILA